MKNQSFKPYLVAFGLVLFNQACGETVNFDTAEKIAPVAANSVPPEGTNGGDAIQNPDGTTSDGTDTSTKEPERGKDGLPLACQSDKVVSVDQDLDFPEIEAGTTCKFDEGDNLSRVNGKIRAYLTQEQKVTIPDGSFLCGFELEHDNSSMRYDDEMFFSVNNRLLLATKDYGEFFPSNDGFQSFSWDGLKNQVYDSFDGRGVYCVGGAEGLTSCSVPPTETQGQIRLSFGDEMKATLARSLQDERELSFQWITTGDNDDSDCRHTDIKLKLKLRYVKP